MFTLGIRTLPVIVLVGLTAITAAEEPSEWSGQAGPGRPVVTVARDQVGLHWLRRAFGLPDSFPKVDFGTHIVVGIGLGMRPTGGYGVTILDCESRAGTLSVRYTVQTPGGRIVTQALTAPFQVKILPCAASGSVMLRAVENPEDRAE